MTVLPLTETELARFWVKVDRRGADDCWPWLAATSKRRNPKFYLRGHYCGGHRVMFELERGPIPDHEDVRRTCKTVGCINPSHMRLGPKYGHVNPQDRADQAIYHRYKFLQKKYGVSRLEYEQRMVAQGHACAICKDPVTIGHVDHDHATGQIRGLLCRGCNTGLGGFRDRPSVLLAAFEYVMSKGFKLENTP